MEDLFSPSNIVLIAFVLLLLFSKKIQDLMR